MKQARRNNCNAVSGRRTGVHVLLSFGVWFALSDKCDAKSFCMVAAGKELVLRAASPVTVRETANIVDRLARVHHTRINDYQPTTTIRSSFADKAKHNTIQ